MSTCPSKDIHSLYIDGELPQPYKNRFEEHLSQCTECTKKQQLYASICTSLHDDAQNISSAESELDEGYLRLKTCLTYSEVTSFAKPFPFGAYMLKAAPLMAAALIIALFLPLNLLRPATEQNTIIADLPDNSFLTTLADNPGQVVPMQQQGIVVNGNIHPAKLASMMGANHTIRIDASILAEKDMFMPEFSENTIQIKINLFNVTDIPLDQSISFEMPVTLIADMVK